ATARRTLTASAVTSMPMPSPGKTAMANVGWADMETCADMEKCYVYQSGVQSRPLLRGFLLLYVHLSRLDHHSRFDRRSPCTILRPPRSADNPISRIEAVSDSDKSLSVRLPLYLAPFNYVLGVNDE